MVHAFKLENPSEEIIEEIPTEEKIERAGKFDQSNVYVDGDKKSEKHYKDILRKEAWMKKKREEELKRLKELELENEELEIENALLASQMGKIKSLASRSVKTSKFNRNKEKRDYPVQRYNRKADMIKTKSYTEAREQKEDERLLS